MNLSPSDYSSSLNLSDTIECRSGLTVKDRVQVHNEEVKSTLRKAKREQLIQFTVSAINLNRRATNMIGLNSKISQCYGSTKNPVTRTKSILAEIRIRQEIRIGTM